MSYQASTHAAKHVALLQVMGLVVLLEPILAWGACDPLMADRPLLREASLAVQGRTRQSINVDVPPNAHIVAFAQERGIDVTLEVKRVGKAVRQADNPIRRTGVQRIAFESSTAGAATVSVIGKEHAGAHGTIDLRIVTLDASSERSECTAVQKQLAEADAAYASGQSVTSGTNASASTDAPSSYKAAAAGYSAVTARLEASGPSLLVAQARHAAAAVLYLDLNDWKGSSATAHQAAQDYAAVSEPYGKARAEALEAAALMEIDGSPANAAEPTGSLRRARTLFAQLAQFHRVRGEAYDEALALNNLGLTYYVNYELSQATPHFRRAIALFDKLGERPRQAIALQNIALVESELGHLAEAIDHYTQVLKIIGPDDPRVFGRILNNSALAQWGMGNHDAALRQYAEALGVARRIDDSWTEALALQGLGSVYSSIGDGSLALDFFRQALELRPADRDARGRAVSLRAIGNILRIQGDAKGALAMHREALRLGLTPVNRAIVSIQIARDLDALGERAQEQAEIEGVLRRAGPADAHIRASALLERSRMRAADGDVNGAEADLRTALPIFRAYEHLEEESDSWVAMARLMRKRGDSAKSFEAVDKALALAEELRVQSANPELRATRLQPLRPAFDLKISLLADQYFASTTTEADRERIAMRALLTAESARARALADFQRFDVSAGGVAPAAVKERTRLYRELAGRRLQLRTALDRTGAEDPLVAPIRAEITLLRQQLDQIDAQIAEASAAAAKQATSAQQTTAFDRRMIPADVGIIEYWLGSESAFAWLLTRDRLTMTRLGPSEAIVDGVRKWHTALQSFGAVPKSERLQLAARLHSLILQPLGSAISAKRTLLFAPDGALHYVSFAALRSDGSAGQFLIAHHDVAVTPSITNLLSDARAKKRAAPTKEMLLVADPVYDAADTRLAQGDKHLRLAAQKDEGFSLRLFRGATESRTFPRLPGSAREAQTIAGLLPASRVDRLEGLTATRERFLGSSLSTYRFIHVASHAVTDAEIPQLSALILSTVDSRRQPIDGEVLAADLINTQLNADTVVLSGCETALGKNVAGEGLMGLRYVMLARGARSVISSFWPVLDDASAELMRRFYASRLNSRSDAVVALSAAMRTMAGSPGPWSDPALWGAFGLTVSDIHDVSATSQ